MRKILLGGDDAARSRSYIHSTDLEFEYGANGEYMDGDGHLEYKADDETSSAGKSTKSGKESAQEKIKESFE